MHEKLGDDVVLKKSVFPSVALAIILSLSACGSSPEKVMPTSATTCTEPATVISISPDPAYLNQPVTIHVPESSSKIAVQDKLTNLTIRDSANSVKYHRYTRLPVVLFYHPIL